MEAVAEQTLGQIEGQTSPKAKRKAPKTAYKKGQSGNPSGKPKPPVPEPQMPEGLAVREESQLEAMRWVMMNGKAETVQQWQMLRWFEKDQKSFLAAKSSLERTAPIGSAVVSVPPGVGTSSIAAGKVEDLGTERVLELAGELVARLAEGV